MPLLQYFGGVGSFLLAALCAANWLCCASIASVPSSAAPLAQKLNIRIHTDHKWPERVVFDTTSSTFMHPDNAAAEPDLRARKAFLWRGRTGRLAEAFAGRCLRLPCSPVRQREAFLISANPARASSSKAWFPWQAVKGVASNICEVGGRTGRTAEQCRERIVLR